MKTNALPPLPGGNPPGQVIQMASKKKTPSSTGVKDGPEVDAAERKASEKGKYKRPVIDVDPMEVADLEKKLTKLSEGAVDALKDMDHDELHQHLNTLTTHAVQTKRALANDDEINKHKTKVSDLSAPYRETLRGIEIRQRLVVLYAASRGRPTK